MLRHASQERMNETRLGTDVFVALAAIGWADGQLDADEADAIVRAAADEGLSLEEIAAIEESTRAAGRPRRHRSRRDEQRRPALRLRGRLLDCPARRQRHRRRERRPRQAGRAARAYPSGRACTPRRIAREVAEMPEGDRPARYDLAAPPAHPRRAASAGARCAAITHQRLIATARVPARRYAALGLYRRHDDRRSKPERRRGDRARSERSSRTATRSCASSVAAAWASSTCARTSSPAIASRSSACARPRRARRAPRRAGGFTRRRAPSRSSNHPAIVRARDFGQLADGSPFFVMDVLPGRSVHEWMHTMHLPWNVIWAMVDQVLAALAHAHARGVIHGDLKPSNIMLDLASTTLGPRAFVLDLGPRVAARVPARLAARRRQRARGGRALRAPERWAGSRPSRSAGRRRSWGRRPTSTRSAA